MDTGRHTYELESLSVYDRTKMKWAERVTGISSGMLERPTTTSVASAEEVAADQMSAHRAPKMGWALEQEINRLDLRNAIDSEIARPEHPIIVNEVNICQLASEGNLHGLKLVKLKSLCQTLDLKIEGSAARKKSYIDPLLAFFSCCQCQEK